MQSPNLKERKMGGEEKSKKITAASARAHTRNNNKSKSSFSLG